MTALSSVQDILTAATACGLSMTPAGDRLELKSTKAPPTDLLNAIRAHKPEILATLSQRPAGLALAECLSRLQAMPYPADIEVDRWALFLTDAAAFVALWGPQAERTGWQASDLFAVPGGLCWVLEGREVAALSIAPSEATIRATDAGAGPGATVAFHRSAKPMPLPWEPQP
jgi:hypothetical protein